MKIKKFVLGASLSALTAITLASCSSSTRNTVTPYGNLNLNATVATANDGKLSLNLKTYYNSLKYSGYDVITDNIKKSFYQNEYNALYALFKYESLSSAKSNNVTDSVLNALIYTDDVTTNGYTAQGQLFELTEDKYKDLREDLLETINSDLSSKIYGVTDYTSLVKLTDSEINEKVTSFIDSMALIGITITESDISYKLPTDTGYTLNKDCTMVQFSDSLFNKLTSWLDSEILTQARNLSAKKALYVIADEDYIYDEDSEELTKNSNYLFSDDDIKNNYEQNQQTYGTYNVITIAFNSRREANKVVAEVEEKLGYGLTEESTEAQKKEFYLELWKTYYNYKASSVTSTDDEKFMYTISKNVNDFDDTLDVIKTLVTESLEDGDCLYEPRNLSQKYVMAYRISTEYVYHKDNDVTEAKEFGDLTETEKATLTEEIKESILKTNASNYTSTNEQNIISEGKLKIYDPYFEYKYNYSNSDYYDLITTKVSATSDVLFSYDGQDYTIAEFIDEASKKYAQSIITNYFKTAYAETLYDGFVEDKRISDDLRDDNKDTLNDAISSFKKNKNSTYPKSVGLETFLLGTYGYDNKEDVLKYYYDGAKALTIYQAIYAFDEWSSAKANEDGGTLQNTTILENLLKTGNKNYDKIFSLNIDHILINIDEDSDGSPDDPQEFLKDASQEEKDAFNQAVVELAQAIYKEAVTIYNKYSENTYLEILTYIKGQYEKGMTLESDPTKTWDDYKKYNFLLTAEALASSSNVTQDSVSSYVTPFKNYVVNMYDTIVKNNVGEKYGELESGAYKINDGDGVFYIYNTSTKEGYVLNDTEDETIAKIDENSLCATTYGYHLIILNSYETTDSTTYTSSSDSTGYYQNLQVVIRKYLTDLDDSDSASNSVYVTLNAYNTSSTEANLNQFFIYYMGKVNSTDNSSISQNSSIEDLLSTLFDDVIEMYESSNFQNYLLLSKLNIKINSEVMYTTDLSKYDYVSATINNLKHNITNYGEDSDLYEAWIDGTYDWTRPDGK